MALLLLIVGPLAALRTPTDIFPEIRIPVIAVAWSYTGLAPDQMSGRISSPFQRILTTAVNDIEHIEPTPTPASASSRSSSSPASTSPPPTRRLWRQDGEEAEGEGTRSGAAAGEETAARDGGGGSDQ